MSSYTYNSITIKGTKASVSKVKSRILVTEEYIKELEKRNEGLEENFQIHIPSIGKLSFNRLIPRPTNIYSGMLSDDEKEKYGAENCWYDWNCDHWGTKWDAYDQSIKMPSKTVLNIGFMTAWCPPINYLEALAQVCVEECCEMSGKFWIEDDVSGKFYIDENNEFQMELLEEDW